MTATWYHLYDPATETHYINGGFIDPESQVPEDGFQWVEGQAPEGAVPYYRLTLRERLQPILAAVLESDTLSVEDRVHFLELRLQVISALDLGDAAAAQFVIQNATLADGSPFSPEIEAVRAVLLAQF